MGNTAYIITRGCYSDYEICAVTLNKDRAERLKQLYSNRMDEAEIEEWELDKGPRNEEAFKEFYEISIDRCINTNHPYIGNRISDKVTIREITENVSDSSPKWFRVYDKKRMLTTNKIDNGLYHFNLRVYISKKRAETEEKAKKIAYDIFAEEMAARGGLT